MASAAGVAQVGIGEAAWVAGAGVLSTVGLGSCVAVVIHDPVARAGGLVHFQLADATSDPGRARQQPFLFGDHGISALSQALASLGCVPVRCKVQVIGGASMMAQVSAAQIGKRNVLSARKTLWKLGYLIEREVVGGEVSRSVSLDVARGDVMIRESGGRS
ncbi:MAG: chemotaxis protein CheD [Deltaproteobacteria bacterium]|nr:chemotaxis protein CheD [Deltaproteobacteria bacterium]